MLADFIGGLVVTCCFDTSGVVFYYCRVFGLVVLFVGCIIDFVLIVGFTLFWVHVVLIATVFETCVYVVVR